MTAAGHLRALGACLAMMVAASGASALDAGSPSAPGTQSAEAVAIGSTRVNSKPALSVPPMAPSTGAANAGGPQPSASCAGRRGGRATATGRPGRRSRDPSRTRPEFRHPDTAECCIRHRRLSARSADPAARGCGEQGRRAVRLGDRARDPEAVPRAPADRDRDIRVGGPVAGAARAGGTGRRKSIPGGGCHRSFGHAAIEHRPRKAAGALHDCAQARESRAGSAALWLVLDRRHGGRSARRRHRRPSGLVRARGRSAPRRRPDRPDRRAPAGVQIEGGDDSALPYRARPGDGS